MLFDLVFEGGGVRGVAFVGALQALAANGHQIGRVMGTSVGGLTAALLTAGYDVQAIQETIIDTQTGRLALAKYLVTEHEPFTAEAIGDSAGPSFALLSGFQQQYIQIKAETFILGGDTYNIGNISDSTVAVGEGAKAEMNKT